ncbi:MAG: type II toxin-antitoxin system VapC family toxin [Sporichthyaceae bacterium]
MPLLDTHVAVWVLDGDSRLGTVATGLVHDAVDVYVSAASVWELTIKAMLGRVRVEPGLPARLSEAGLELLAVAPQHAEGLRRFPELTRHDPFDRLLLAQASVENLPFLTADRILLGLGHEFVLDATR